jgi:four helix bundle protein
MKNQAGDVILAKSITFSSLVVEYMEILENKKRYVVAHQLLRSGTSIRANIHEAQNVESKADFIHKFKTATKEVEETKYWLILCKQTASYPDCNKLIDSLHEIDKIITKIIATSKSKVVTIKKIVELINWQIESLWNITP